MNKDITIKDIIKRWQLIVASMSILALIAFTVSVVLPAKYQSDVSVIVIQEQASEKVDAFSATKSAEFLSNIFTRVIYTTTFFNSVQDAPFDVRRDFSRDPQEREKQWKKFISVKKVNNTGIIHISVIDGSRKTAEETAKAIAYVLTTDSQEYHGGGERVNVKLIDGPNTPLRPTLPRILPNTLVGAILGFILSIVLIYFFPSKIQFAVKSRTHVEDVVTGGEVSEIHELNDEEESDVVTDHFNNNVHGSIEFEDDELENNLEQKSQDGNVDIAELHNRISNFIKQDC
ncbi:MAG TPA: hypothetical protein EYG99_01660 [Candidatus Pacebacteria bacterium]|nr:hypothetical protein [Candidatus Paceibacterota bacterium]